MNGNQPTTMPAPAPAPFAPPPPAIPPTAPVQAPKKNLKPLIIVIMVAVVLAVLGAAGYFLWQSQQSQQIIIEQQEKVENQISDALSRCDQAPNPERCRQDLVEESALSSGNTNLCSLLEAEAFDFCIYNLVQESGQPELCAQISDQALARQCSDNYYRDAASEDQDISLCTSIVDPDKKLSCQLSILPSLDHAACQQQGFSQAECDRVFVTKQAEEAADPALCSQQLSSEEDIAYCLERVTLDDPDKDGLDSGQESLNGTDPRNPDTDGDGLNDYEEVNIYTTDPLNPDTDGDSYSDGQEVQGGYNPKGEGRL